MERVGYADLTNKNPCALAHGQSQISPLKNPWQALRAATQKAALSGDKIAISSDLEPRPGFEPGTSSFTYTPIYINVY